MRHLILMFIVIGMAAVDANAQITFSLQSFSSGGTSLTGGTGLQFTQTVGEPIIGTSKDGITYTQGFQQSFGVMGGTLSFQEMSNDLNITMFPNPVMNALSIEFSENTLVDYHLRIYNSIGTLAIDMIIPKGSSLATLNTSELSAGIYVMHIRNEKGTAFVSHKLIKH